MNAVTMPGQQDLSFLEPSGEIGVQISSTDWSATALGPASNWPQSLRTALSLMLFSRFPMLLFWGRELNCFYNDAFRPSLGNDGKDRWAIGMRGEEMWAEIWAVIYPWIQQVLEGGQAVQMENQLVPFYRDGKLEDIYWTFCYSAAHDESGEIAGVFVVCTETTQAIASQRQLKESEHFARNIIMHSEAAQAVWIGNDLVFEFVNERMLEIYGKGKDLKGKTLRQAISEPEVVELEGRVRQVFFTGIPYHESERRIELLTETGLQPAYFKCSYTALRNSHGNIAGVLGTLVDVTGLVIARKKLEESEDSFKRLVIKSPVGICIVSGIEIKAELVNDVFLELVGRRREDFEVKAYWDVLCEAREYYAPLLEQVFSTGIPYMGNEHLVRLLRNGVVEDVYINFVYEPIKDENGATNKVMILAIDVTAQVLTRRKIEEAEERSRLAIEVSELGLFDVDLQTNQVISSRRLDEIFDVELTSDRSRYISAIHPDDLRGRKEAYEKAYRDGLLEYECRVIRKDGTVRWVRSRGRIFFDHNYQPAKLVGVSQDITEMKRFEDELGRQIHERTLELQRMNEELQRSNENLEEFAHAASHDLKEPIRKICFFTDRLKTQLHDRLSQHERATLDRIENSSRRMVTLIDDLLQYSYVNQQVQQSDEVDLNDVLVHVIEVLELDIQQKLAQVEVHDLPTIYGNHRQLQQMFQNLVSNALKFSRKDTIPHIIVRASVVHDSDGSTKSRLWHLIEVQDNGIGFDPAYGEMIFQMFQRLHDKSTYEGTGVGLTIVRKVVDNHGGKIVAQGSKGNGALFSIYLPANQELK